MCASLSHVSFITDHCKWAWQVLLRLDLRLRFIIKKLYNKSQSQIHFVSRDRKYMYFTGDMTNVPQSEKLEIDSHDWGGIIRILLTTLHLRLACETNILHQKL